MDADLLFIAFTFFLVILTLDCEQFCVGAILCHQAFVGTLFFDLAIFQENDPVAEAGGCQSVRNED